MWDTLADLNGAVMDLVTADVLADIHAHALEVCPSEACGLILESLDGSGLVRRCVNAQDELHARDAIAHPLTSAQGFCLAAEDQLFLARSFRNHGPVRVLYHSHIDVGAYFSLADRAGVTFEGRPLYEELLHLVVDCRSTGEVRGSRLYAWIWDDFREVAVFPAPHALGRSRDGGVTANDERALEDLGFGR